jgi:hypothetical protein
MPLIAADEADGIVKILQTVLTDPDQRLRMRRWCAYYYGDTTPGASMQRFLDAVERMISERDEWIGRDHDVAAELTCVGPVVG